MSRNTNSHFARGTGCYVCRSCGINTRSTGRGDNEHVKLCADCYDLGGEENHVSDTGELYSGPEWILQMISNISAKGGKVTQWDKLKALANKALEPATPAAPADVDFLQFAF